MDRRVRVAVVIFVWAAAIGLLWFVFAPADAKRLIFAAGPREGEAFELATAIARVTEASGFELEVLETGGSAENLRLLEAGRVDLATIQAGTGTSARTRLIAQLYPDSYQLIVRDGTAIEAFPDLAGHRVAVPPTGSGQYASFWFLAEHYGLTERDFTALAMSADAADFAMILGAVDATFRVRAAGNASIRRLVRDHPMRLVPLPHGAALALKQPALSTGRIPEGSYSGDPPLPARDLPTVTVPRLLIARDDLDADLVQEFTQILFEKRALLVASNPLAGFIRPPGDDSNIAIPLHTGAQRYYDREKPGFLIANARLLATLLYVGAIMSSGFVALRARVQHMRRVRMGKYNRALMEVARQARALEDREALFELRDRLVDMLSEVVEDLDRERVTQDEFGHFSFTWQAVDGLVRDRITLELDGGRTA